jgi:hypothetical protein
VWSDRTTERQGSINVRGISVSRSLTQVPQGTVTLHLRFDHITEEIVVHPNPIGRDAFDHPLRIMEGTGTLLIEGRLRAT